MIDKFVKITVGFICQTFEKNAAGQFVCTEQAFIAGDECSYEDRNGEPLPEAPDYVYQPYEMAGATGQAVRTFLSDLFGKRQ